MPPTESEMGPLATPEATVDPLTEIVAVLSVTVGLTVIEVVAFVTLAVKMVVPAENVGLKVPELKIKPESVQTDDGRRVTVIV